MKIEIDPSYLALEAVEADDATELMQLLHDRGDEIDRGRVDGMGLAHWAAFWGSVQSLSVLIANGCDLEHRAEGVDAGHPGLHPESNPVLAGLVASRLTKRFRYRGYTPLMIAAERNDTEVLRLLKDAGVDLDSSDPNGGTALMKAADAAAEAAVSFLVNAGADISVIDSYGNRALFFACRRGTAGTILPLLEKGADPWSANRQGYTPFMAAAGHADTEIVERIIEDHVGNPERINWSDEDGCNALFSSAARGRVDTLRSLIGAGGFPGAVTKRGETLLIAATKAGSERVCRVLIDEALVDIGARDRTGRTALDYALLEGYEALADALQSAGCERGAAVSAQSASNARRIVSGMNSNRNG
jgi:ankyrin repeat protein